ncbi:MAG: hypothetical protein M5R40_10040 [Anaerolineae bacterium]|nr:hypothetical protein [Anaerolineae bacterium]
MLRRAGRVRRRATDRPPARAVAARRLAFLGGRGRQNRQAGLLRALKASFGASQAAQGLRNQGVVPLAPDRVGLLKH